MRLDKLKRHFVALLCAGASLSVMAQDYSLIVTTKSAGKVVYALSQKPVVTFTATDVVITTASAVVSYPLTDHVNFTFGEGGDTGIGQMADVKAVIACSENQISVSNAEAGAEAGVYSVDGKLIQSAKADSKGNVALSVSGKGVYVVRVGKLVFKVRK